MTGLVDFGIVKPELGGSFGAGYADSQQNRMAREEQQTKLDQLKSDRQTMLQLQEQLKAAGKDPDLNKVFDALIATGKPDYVMHGVEGKQRLKAQDEYAHLFDAVATPAAPALGAVAPTAPAPALGTGMFGTGVPTNALAPAPTNALAPTDTRFADMQARIDKNLAFSQRFSDTPQGQNAMKNAELLQRELHMLKTKNEVPEIATMQRLGYPLTQAGLVQFKSDQRIDPNKLLTPEQEAQQIRLRQAGRAVTAEASSTGDLTPEALDIAAQLTIQTGQIPALGQGKAAGAIKAKILNRVAELSSGDNAAGAASNIVGNKVALAGTTAGARTAGTTSTNISIAADEASRMIPIAETYVAKVNPTDYPTLNAVGNYVASRTGDPNITGLATSLNSLVNSYARAINPKGTPTVSDKNHAREVINSAMAKGQLSEAFSVMRQEMGAAKAASSGHVGGGGKSTPSGIPAAAIADLKAGVGTDAQFDEHFGVGSAARVRGGK